MFDLDLCSCLFEEYFMDLLDVMYTAGNPLRRQREEEAFSHLLEFIEELERKFTWREVFVLQISLALVSTLEL